MFGSWGIIVLERENRDDAIVSNTYYTTPR